MYHTFLKCYTDVLFVVLSEGWVLYAHFYCREPTMMHMNDQGLTNLNESTRHVTIHILGASIYHLLCITLQRYIA